MGDFNRDRKFGRRDSSRPSYRDSRRSGRDSDRPERRDFRKEVEMHSATCDKCGARCEVPFKPSGSKPVYCSDCFRKGENFESKSPDQYKKEFGIINEKLDKILEALGKD
ncbi:MAG: CxxC-x17-CxxC domain-containing protein [Nanoarchaeota archaeon]